MGDVVFLAERRRMRAAADPARAELFLCLSDPFGYLAAERVERNFADVAWRPACWSTLVEDHSSAVSSIRERAEQRAAELRLPLQWPERFPAPVPAAMRAATYAAEQGRGGAFVLAAGRLAFGGGFDLEDPEVLEEVAAAAGLDVDACLRAANEPERDAAVMAHTRRVRAAGVRRLPALRAGGTLVWGEERISAFLLVGAAGAAARG
jgi:2-hydroxychromene-2-carboxylate isomerase